MIVDRSEGEGSLEFDVYGLKFLGSDMLQCKQVVLTDQCKLMDLKNS